MKKLSVYAHVCAAGFCLLFSGEAAAQIAVESMHVANATLQIDGDLSDWSGKKAESNNVDFIVLGGGDIEEDGGKNTIYLVKLPADVARPPVTVSPTSSSAPPCSSKTRSMPPASTIVSSAPWP